MPTKLPRILFTLKAEDLDALDRLSEKLGKPKSAVLRKALRELAKRELG